MIRKIQFLYCNHVTEFSQTVVFSSRPGLICSYRLLASYSLCKPPDCPKTSVWVLKWSFWRIRRDSNTQIQYAPTDLLLLISFPGEGEGAAVITLHEVWYKTRWQGQISVARRYRSWLSELSSEALGPCLSRSSGFKLVTSPIDLYQG